MGDYPLAEHSFGVAFKDHVLLAVSSDTGVPFLVHGYEDKIARLPGENQALAITGSVGDRVQFSEYIIRNVALNRFRTLQHQHMAAKAHWIRNVLASSIRSRSPFYANVLYGGFDVPSANTTVATSDSCATADCVKPAQLWWLDCLGAMSSVRYAGHGRLISFAIAVFDRYYDENMTIDQSVALLNKALDTVRASVHPPSRVGV